MEIERHAKTAARFDDTDELTGGRLSSTTSGTTHIPMTFRSRGSKTVIVLPDGSRGVIRQEATIDNTMVKVIARAFRWQRLLVNETYGTIEDLAAAEKINPSYVSRVLRLALSIRFAIQS